MAGMSITGDALLGAGGSLVGNVASLIAGRSNADRAFKQQKELMALQNQYSIENWNRENAYNTPKAQMERLKSAGLNPNLVYNGGAGALQSGAISAPSAPGSQMAPTPDFSSSVSDAVNLALGISQADKNNNDSLGQKLSNIFNERTLDDRVTAVAKQNNWTDADVKRIKAQTKEIFANVDLINQNLQNAIKSGLLTDQEIENLKKQNILIDAQTTGQNLANEKAQLEINWYPIVANAQVKQALAAANRDNAAAALSGGELKKLEAMLPLMLEGMQSENGQKSLQLMLDQQFGKAERVMGLISTGVGSVCKVLESVLPAKAASHVVGKITTYFAGGKRESYQYSK